MLFDALALLAGLLLPLAFAPFNAAFLAVVCMALLFSTWLEATPGQAFRRGYLFGMGQFCFGISWIYNSLHDYGGASSLEATGLTGLFSMILSLYPALAGWVSVRLFPTGNLRVLTAFPADWILAEWQRGWSWSGFPWLQLGYSQMDGPLAGLAPVFGVFGVSFALAFLAGLLLLAPRWKGQTRNLALISVVILMAGAYALGRINWTSPAGTPFKATLIQGNTPQNLKWEPSQQKLTMDMYTDLTRQHWDSKLIVWPETAIPAFYQQIQKPFLIPLEAEALAHDSEILLGIPYYEAANDRYYNAMAVVGRKPGVYLKRHLVPFGEFLPMRPIFGWVLNILEIPLSDFGTGTDNQIPLEAAGYKLAASICYEDVFGHESLAALPDASYLVNVTNDAWFGDSMAPRQHVQMARMRSLETGRWMLRATNSGVTAFIDPKGTITDRLPLFQQGTLSAEVTPMQGTTPYIIWGDWFVVCGSLATLAGLWFFTKSQKHHPQPDQIHSDENHTIS